MGHRCEYESKLTLHGDEIVNEVTAVYSPKKGKVKKELVYEEHEDGLNYCRYLYHSAACGYVVCFPGERLNYYYGYQEQKIEDLTECKRLGFYRLWLTKNEDLEEIAKARPELKYLIQKYKGNDPTQFLDIVIKYKKNPSIEALIDKSLYALALDKRLEKLCKKKQLEVINFIKNNDIKFDISLSQILFCLKNKVDIKDVSKYAKYKYNYKLTNYLDKQNKDLYYYQDYIRMCKSLEKNLKDEYWLYPNDLQKAHDKVMADLENKRKIDKALREEKERKKREKLLIDFEKIGNQFKHLNTVLNEFNIYIPTSLNDVEQQAKVLHQCLITANYPSKMVNKKSILVFIKKDEKPLATAEISYSKKLIQFYGDECDRKNCKPNEEIQNLFNQWLERITINRPKEVAM